MKRILDVDPLTHTTQYHHYDDATGKTTIETVQNIEPYLKEAKRLRDDESYTQQGIKNEMWHYAKIPNTVIEQIQKNFGVNVFEKGQEKEVLKILNTHYPYLKTTNGRHT